MKNISRNSFQLVEVLKRLILFVWNLSDQSRVYPMRWKDPEEEKKRRQKMIVGGAW